ncbi:MAG: signal recognition particle protein Srp19 [Candidatus Thermoplasmatota archaeon]|nr:signal recognition particle protein Srp19 [Candidatus Thermoplasmatota archaeon]MBU1941752.1 signal recognition particle protein Srp19 [Candidatus Thermoplasmatota archaeon]
MASRGDKTFVIWPSYFDKNLTRNKGRKVAQKHAVDKPQLDALIKAARSLNLNPHVEKEAAHPSRPYLHEGRILVDKQKSKSEILKQIAQRI